jgi:hypothetical protein
MLRVAEGDYERALVKLQELGEFNGVLIEENENLGREIMGMRGRGAG